MPELSRPLDASTPVDGAETWPPEAPRGYAVFKRLSDVIVGSLVLVLGSPIWVLVGLIIRLTSPGPALYRGVQVGLAAKPFTYYKFRTMRQGSDQHHRDWLKDFVLRDRPYAFDEDQQPIYKAIEDPRVTRIGRLLRRTSLDEVPQFINVVVGQMSVVGPRPTHPAEFEHFDARAKRRLAVKPGITGLYQIEGRGRVPFSRVLELDMEYIRRRSVGMDLRIMARTAAAMISGRGAA